VDGKSSPLFRFSTTTTFAVPEVTFIAAVFIPTIVACNTLDMLRLLPTYLEEISTVVTFKVDSDEVISTLTEFLGSSKRILSSNCVDGEEKLAIPAISLAAKAPVDILKSEKMLSNLV